jgi:hypothetical protein
MIRSKKVELIDPVGRVSGLVYVEAKKRRYDEENGLVIVDNVFSFIESKETVTNVLVEGEEEYCSGVDAEGNKIFDFRPAMVKRRAKILVKNFVPFKFSEAKFKISTFEEVLNNPKVSQYDAVLIQQIEFCNTKEWSGNEIQKHVYFYNWTASDLEIVTEEQKNELLAPEILELL